MNELPLSKQESADIPSWRMHRHTGRSSTHYDLQEGKFKKEKPKLPEQLYRQVPIEDLYLIWRDKEMPLQHFQKSHHSSVEENSVGNFWFTQPVALDAVQGYIITEPSRWKQLPEFVQESYMAFKSDKKRAKMGEWGMWHPHSILSEVPEVHTGNRLTLEELTICLPMWVHAELREEQEALQQMGKHSPTNQRISEKLAIRIGKIRWREHGDTPADSNAMQGSEHQRMLAYGIRQLQDQTVVGALDHFYTWALTLPVIPRASMPEDVDRVAEDDTARKRNEEAFLKFYQSIKK